MKNPKAILMSLAIGIVGAVIYDKVVKPRMAK